MRGRYLLPVIPLRPLLSSDAGVQPVRPGASLLRQLRERDVEVLRQRWDEGKASGRAGPLDVPRLIAEERAKLEGTEGERD